MGAIAHLEAIRAIRIALADEPPLSVGRLVVDPPTRQVSSGDRQETIEPRVMQVLVALARCRGHVVPRDALVECCWEGRAVSEDAINRVLSRLRQLSADLGGGTFQIETIRRVGFRLTENAEQRSSEPRAAVSRRSLIAGSTAVAATLGGGAWFLRRPEHKPAPLALQYYQRGLDTRGQASLELAEQGAALFREATRIDPQFADAWGALAWSYRGLPEFGDRPDAARLRSLCLSAAAHALKLDPDNPDAQAALLLLKPFYRNWEPIERGCRSLLRQHPHHSIIQYNLSLTLNQVGRWRESVPLFREICDREPFWPLTHLRLILALYESGSVEEADDLIDDGMKRFPRRRDYWLWRMRHLLITGRVPEAIAFANDVNNRPAIGTEPAIDFEVGIANALADGSESARRSALDRVLATARRQVNYAPSAACSACVLGFPSFGLSILEGYYFGRGSWPSARSNRPITELLFVGSTASLRALPRFADLLTNTGLANYWTTTGTLPDYRRQTDTFHRRNISQ